MKLLLISVGSRGDIEPFLALAQALLDDGHEVHYALQNESNYQSIVPSGVTVHPLPFVSNDFYKFMNPSHGADHPNPRVRFVGVVTDLIGELVLPCYQQVMEVAKDCDVIVTSSLARSLAFALTQELSIPTYLVHLQPLLPTGLFPHYSNADEFVECMTKDPSTLVLKDDYLEGYWELERFQYDFLKERLDKMYADNGLAPLLTFDENKKILSGNSPSVHIVNAFSNDIFPPTPDAGPNVHDVGALGDAYVPKAFEPPVKDSDLVTFLNTGAQKPICIGFGSMPYDAEKVQGLLNVVQELEQRVVLVGKALTLPESLEKIEWIEQNVRHVDGLPYAWLLPQCSVMVSHGGAGVMHAALRAGCACVISPLMGDQFVHAKLLEKKGLGAQAGQSMNSMTMEEFKSALEKALQCRDTASALGAQMRNKENYGVEKLVKILKAS